MTLRGETENEWNGNKKQRKKRKKISRLSSNGVSEEKADVTSESGVCELRQHIFIYLIKFI